MTERLRGIVDHLKDLLHGDVASLDRPIPKRRFDVGDIPVEYRYLEAANAPYPVDVDSDDGGDTEGFFEAIYNTAGNDQYSAERMRLRVGYMGRPTENYNRDQEIRLDRRTIIRCLSLADSWEGATGFVRTANMGHRLDATPIPDEEEEDVNLIIILEISFDLVYREDMTS